MSVRERGRAPGARSMWHKADISISTGILPTISRRRRSRRRRRRRRRRHGDTTLSAETCIPPVISRVRE